MKIKSFKILLPSLLLSSATLIAAPPATPPKYTTIKNVTSTIVITQPGTYDFSGILHIWKGTNWNCNGEKENGPQILRVEASNVIIKNFYYIGDGKTRESHGLGDPIHIATCGKGQGNLCPGTVSNVTLDGIYGHACEDMISIGTPGSENITIQNSVLFATPDKAHWDKTLQLSFGRNTNIINNRFVGGERCIRFLPSTSGSVRGNIFDGCNQPVKASSNDAAIVPMKNGPSTVEMRRNTFKGSSNQFRCNNSQFKGDGIYDCK